MREDREGNEAPEDYARAGDTRESGSPARRILRELDSDERQRREQPDEQVQATQPIAERRENEHDVVELIEP